MSIVSVCAVAAAGTPSVSFFPQAVYEISGSQPQDVIVADFNRDQVLDLAVPGSAGEGEVSVLLGAGDGTFDDIRSIHTFLQAYGLACGDFDGDLNPDLAVMGGGHESQTVAIYIGDGTGDFTPLTTLAAGMFPIAAVCGDFNGDQVPDLAVANNVLYGLTIFLGVGDGTFSSAAHVPGVAWMLATDIAAGDVNNDQILDLAVSHYSGVSVFIGAGDGTFNVAGGAGSNNLTESVAVGELNGDDDADIASVEIYAGRAVLSFGMGDGSFVPGTPMNVGSFLRDVAIADLNKDGNGDIVIAHEVGNNLSLLLGAGGGTFLSKLTFATGWEPRGIAFGDWNGDGYLDLAAPNRNLGDTPTVSVLIQRVPGDVDGDGDVDTADFAIFAQCFGGALNPPAPACPAGVGADLDGDGDVDTADFALFSQNFTGSQ